MWRMLIRELLTRGRRLAPTRRSRTRTPAYSNGFPPSLSCRVEFGTGFLPPETGAPKRDLRRYLCAETGNRRPPHPRNGRKNGFSACELSVAGFGRLGGGVRSLMRTDLRAISLLTGKLTGNFANLRLGIRDLSGNSADITAASSTIPCSSDQGIALRRTGNMGSIAGITQPPALQNAGESKRAKVGL